MHSNVVLFLYYKDRILEPNVIGYVDVIFLMSFMGIIALEYNIGIRKPAWVKSEDL